MAETAVAILDAWDSTGAFQSTYKPTGGIPFSISAGDGDHPRRCLVVFVTGESDAGTLADVSSVSYGGQTLTEIGDCTGGTSATVSNYIWGGYLLDAGIVAATGSPPKLDISWTTEPNQSGTDDVSVMWATYQYVDQANPIADSGVNGSDGTNSYGETVTGLSIPEGAQCIYGATWQTTSTPHAPTGSDAYTEQREFSGAGSQTMTNAVATRTATTATTNHTAGGTSMWDPVSQQPGRNGTIAMVLDFEGIWGRDGENTTAFPLPRWDAQGGSAPTASNMLITKIRMLATGTEAIRLGVYTGGGLGDGSAPYTSGTGPYNAARLYDFGTVTPSHATNYNWETISHPSGGVAWSSAAVTWCTWKSLNSGSSVKYDTSGNFGDFQSNATQGRYTVGDDGSAENPATAFPTTCPVPNADSLAVYSIHLVWKYSTDQTLTAGYAAASATAYDATITAGGVSLSAGYVAPSATAQDAALLWSYLSVDVIGNKPDISDMSSNTLLYDGDVVPGGKTNFNEPSGMIWNPTTAKLWAVDDGNPNPIVVSMDRDNSNAAENTGWSSPFDDLEEAMLAEYDSGFVYVMREGGGDPGTSPRLIQVTASTLLRTGRYWDLSDMLPTTTNKACEACCFVPDHRAPYGGYWYLGKEQTGHVWIYSIDLTNSVVDATGATAGTVGWTLVAGNVEIDPTYDNSTDCLDGFFFDRERNVLYCSWVSYVVKYQIDDPANPTFTPINWASGSETLTKGDALQEGVCIIPSDESNPREIVGGGDMTSVPGIHIWPCQQGGNINAVGGIYGLGQTINLTATPASGYQVKAWSGTDNDSSKATTNAVTLSTTSELVLVEFEAQVILTAGYVAPSVTVYDGTLTPGGVTLTAGYATPSEAVQVWDATITAGAVTLTAGYDTAIAKPWGGPTATITAGAITLTAGDTSATATAQDATLTSTITLTAGYVAPSATPQDATLSAGAVTLTAGYAAASAAAQDATLTAGAVTLTAGYATASAAAQDATISGGEVLTAGYAAASASPQDATLTAGAVTLTAGYAAPLEAVQVWGATISVGSVTLTAGYDTAVAKPWGGPTATITAGAITLTAGYAATSATAYDATIDIGTVITAGYAAASVTAYDATLTPGAVTLEIQGSGAITPYAAATVTVFDASFPGTGGPYDVVVGELYLAGVRAMQVSTAGVRAAQVSTPGVVISEVNS